ncbi:MAG: response regulator [Deltaproteobacteria bacterium]|nr:response regulator [Deltaproteobacteria bacterium]
MNEDKTGNFRVLAADDEELILKVYRDILLKKIDDASLSEISDLEAQLFGKKKPEPAPGYSFELVTCRQGDEAIAAVRQAIEEDNPFSLALLDIRMPPGPDGVKTAEAIRALDPLIEILMVTGYSDVDPREIAQRVHPPHKLLYIQKPFHPQEIYQFVCTLCAKWKNEAFIRNYNERLLSHIEEQTTELKKANQELREEIRVREESETALRESEEKFRDLFEKSSDHLYLHDLEGNLISTNLAFKNECGYDEEYLNFRNIRDLIPDRYRDKFDEYLKRIVEKGYDEDIMILRTGNGKELVLECKNSLIRDSEGKPVAVRGAGRDISERLKIEEQKHNLEVQLMRMQRMEALGTLAGGIAHNFNNLLMGILGNSSLASLEIDANHNVQKNLENIRTLVESGSRLTRQLFDYSKSEANVVRTTDLNMVIKKTAEAFGGSRNDIRIHYQLEDACNIDADRGQIEQALFNFFINAGDAMPSGGDIFLETRIVSHLEIVGEPSDVKAGDYVRLIIKDTGVGMDEETKGHLFEPFFTTKGFVKGTGLGLASAYGIIKAHGGYIHVISEKGEGASFSIYLPVSIKKITSEEHEGQDIAYGTETVLLVDDENIVLETSEQLLRYLGYSVIKAQGGREAIEIFSSKRGQIDLVILDLIMSDVRGEIVFDTLVKIKKDVKVILSSGYGIDDKTRDIINRGCKGFIQKPFDIKDLSLMISEILKEKS